MSSIKFPIDESDKTLVKLYKMVLEEYFKAFKIPNMDETISTAILYNYITYLKCASPKTNKMVTNKVVTDKVKDIRLTKIEQLIVDNVGYASLIFVCTLNNFEDCIQAINITYAIFDKCYGLGGVGDITCINKTLKEYIVNLILKSEKGRFNMDELENLTTTYIRDVEDSVHDNYNTNQNLTLHISFMDTILEKAYNTYELPMGIVSHIAAYTLYIVCLHFKLPAFSLLTQKIKDVLSNGYIDLRNGSIFSTGDDELPKSVFTTGDDELPKSVFTTSKSATLEGIPSKSVSASLSNGTSFRNSSMFGIY